MIKSKQTFSHDLTVTYSDINNQGVASTSVLVDYLQITASLHGDKVGYSTEWFLNNNIGWALLGWNLKIYRHPGEGEHLTIDTWTKNYRRVQANRDFQITDKTGNLILSAQSRWFLIDTNKRKPLRLKEEFFLPYLFENSPECELPSYKISLPEDCTQVSEFVYTVIRRDTDTNNHANNVVYIDWAIDAAPEDLYDNYVIDELKVLYKKECRRGDVVECTTFRKNNSTYFVFKNKKDPTKAICKIFMKWVPKS